MTTKTYIVTNAAGANLRACPSTSYPTAAPVKTLRKGADLGGAADGVKKEKPPNRSSEVGARGGSRTRTPTMSTGT